MGNCIETCTPTKEEQEAKKEGAEAGGFEAGVKGAGNDGKESGFKVKVLMTRGELEWLLLQLKENGEKRLEDVLEEIERGRRGKGKGRVEGWKPALECIMEIPEVQSF